MASTITIRLAADAERALALLTTDGTSVELAVRSALISASQARAEQTLREDTLREDTLREEAETLAADEADRAEVARVMREMETLRA